MEIKNKNGSNYIKARFRNIDDNIVLIGKSCVLPISVGQKYHEDEELLATIKLINHSKFEKCSIVLADTLQRHTLRIINNLNQKKSLELSIENGKKWIKKNKSILDKLSMNKEIRFWNEWYENKFYKKAKNAFNKIYKNSEEFKKNFNFTSEEFLTRLINSKKITEKNEKYFDLSTRYLKEECVVMTKLWLEEGFNFVVYPSKASLAISYAFDKILPEKNHLKWLSIRFEKKYFK